MLSLKAKWLVECIHSNNHFFHCHQPKMSIIPKSGIKEWYNGISRTSFIVILSGSHSPESKILRGKYNRFPRLRLRLRSE